MNYARFISKLSAARMPSPIRELNKPWPKEMILLTAGKPNADLFPFTKATLETYDGHKFVLEGDRMKDALQYQPTPGVPDFVKWLGQLQEHVHNPPYKDTGLVVTTGSQDGLCKSFEMCLEPNDPVVVEEFIYPGTLSALNPYSPKYMAIKSDGLGMVPDDLKEKLQKVSSFELFRNTYFVFTTNIQNSFSFSKFMMDLGSF